MVARGEKEILRDRNYTGQMENRAVAQPETERVTPVRQRKVKPHRWCPCCAEGYGIANGRYAHAQRGDIRYYQCNQCGHSWPYAIPLEARANFPPPSDEAT